MTGNKSKIRKKSLCAYAAPNRRSMLETLESRLLYSATLTAEAGSDLITDEGSAIFVDGSFVDTNTGTPGEFELLTLPGSTVRSDFAAHSISGNNVIWYDTDGNVLLFDGTTDASGNPNIVDLTALTGGKISTSGYSVDADGDRVAFNSSSKGVFVYTVSTGAVQQVGSGGSSITNVQIDGDYVTWQKSSGSFLKTFIYNLSDPLATEQLLVNTGDLGGGGSTTEATVSNGIAYWIGTGGAGGYNDVFGKILSTGAIFNVSNTLHDDQNIRADNGVVAWNAQTSAPSVYVFDGRNYNGTGAAPAAIQLDGLAGGANVRPDVSGANVVFESFLTSRDRDIFVYNLDTATTTNISNDRSANSEQFAVIRGNNVVWENTVGGTADLSVYDLTTGNSTPVSTDGIRDYKPMISGGNLSFVSGGALTIALGSSDATYTIDWDFGDGTTLSDAQLGESHTYLNNGVYTVTLTVTSSNGDVATDTATVTVSNLAPTIDSATLDAAAVNEGGGVTLSGSFSDAGTLDTHTLVVDWGDGTTSNATIDQTAGTFAASHTYLDDSPTGTASDLMPISLTLTDNDLDSDSAGVSVTVNNLAPVVSAVTGPTAAVRGQALIYTGSFTDAGTLDTHTQTWTVTDSVGGIVAIGTGSSFEFTPVALDSYTVTYAVTDDDTGTADAGTTLATSVLVVTADPTDPTKTALIIGGGDNSEDIKVSAKNGFIEVNFQDKLTEEVLEFSGLAPADRVIIYGNGGDDKIKIYRELGTTPTMLFGGDGDDSIRGGMGDDIIVGGAGDDKIEGKEGRDLLIGGDGSDDVVGDDDDDILIAGIYTKESDLAYLSNIMSLWQSNNDYLARVQSLQPMLNNMTVLDDGFADRLKGKKGIDYFMLNSEQDESDMNRDELFTQTELSFFDSEEDFDLAW